MNNFAIEHYVINDDDEEIAIELLTDGKEEVLSWHDAKEVFINGEPHSLSAILAMYDELYTRYTDW